MIWPLLVCESVVLGSNSTCKSVFWVKSCEHFFLSHDRVWFYFPVLSSEQMHFYKISLPSIHPHIYVLFFWLNKMLKLLLTISLFAAAQAVGNCGESEGVALCAPSTVTVSLHIEQTTKFRRRSNLFYSSNTSSTIKFLFF